VKQLVQDIVVALEGVPLAIDQAGAYLSIYRNVSAEVLKDFIQKLQSEYDKIMRTIPKRSKWYYEKHRSVVDTFCMLREALTRSNEDADKILTLSAFLAPGNIPISVFSATEHILSEQVSAESAPNVSSSIDSTLKGNFVEREFLMWTEGIFKDKRSFYAAICALESFCCATIRWNTEGTEILSYSIHNAVRLWCQESWQIEDRDKWAVLAAYQLSRSLGRDEEAAVVSRQRYLWHVRYSEGIILRDEPPSCIKAPGGPLWPLAWSTAINFAKFYQGQQYLTESQFHLQKTIEYEKLAIKDEWPNSATSINTLHLLALVFWQSGKFPEAVETFKTLFEASRVVWGSDSELTLKIAEESSRVRLQALENARNWNRAVLATNQEKLAHDRPDHTSTSTSALRNDQITIEMDEFYLKLELEESINLLGEHARDTIAAKDKLANFYSKEGRFADAVPLAEAVWRSRMEHWWGREEDMPTLLFYLSPFSTCLAGYLARGSPISHLVQEFPYVLHHAIMSKFDELIDILLREDTVESFIQSVMVSAVDKVGECPLHKAMVHYDGKQLDKLVDRLLSRGADDTYQTSYGSSLLHLAVAREHDAVVQMLLDRGADIEGKNLSIGATALHYAVFKGNIALVEKLLDRNADLEAKMIEGLTALHLAVLMGYREIVKSLLDYGANPNVQTQLGAGAVHMFVVAELFQSYLRDPGLHRTLEQDYVDSKNAGETQFGAAILSISREHRAIGEMMIVEFVRCYKAQIPLPSVADETEKGDRSILRDLLDSKAYIDLRCVGLSTPLHLALAMASDFPLITNKVHRFYIIRELMDSGADLTSRDAFGMIPSTFNLELMDDEEEEEEEEVDGMTSAASKLEEATGGGQGEGGGGGE
jgi:ankyrin repeat protein